MHFYLANVDISQGQNQGTRPDQLLLHMKDAGLLSVINNDALIRSEPRAFMSSIKALLPPEAMDGLLEPTETRQPNAEASYNMMCKLTFFSLMNNLTAATSNLDEACLRQFKSLSKQQVNLLVQQGTSLGNKALAQNLFKSAVKAGETQIVEMLLHNRNLGIEVNKTLCEYEDHSCTPLELSSYNQDAQTSKILLAYKAKVGPTSEHNTGGPPGGALQAMVNGLKKSQTFNEELTAALLDAGAEVLQSLLNQIIYRRQSSLAAFLVSKVSQSQSHRWKIYELLHDAIDYLDKNAALQIFRVLSRLGAISITFYRDKYLTILAMQKGNLEILRILLASGADLTQKSMLYAVQHGYHEIVKLILSHNVTLSGGLYALAFRNKDKEMMDLLYNVGIDVNDVAIVQSEDRRFWPKSEFPITAFSEAMRRGELENARSFEMNGAWQLIKEKRRFEAALLAGSESGNLDFVRRLLDNGVLIEGVMLGPDYGRNTRRLSYAQSKINELLTRASELSAFHNRTDVCRYLIGIGAGLSSGLLLYTLKTGDQTLAHYVLDHGDGIDDELGLNKEEALGLYALRDRSLLEKFCLIASDAVFRCALEVGIEEKKWSEIDILLNTRTMMNRNWIVETDEDGDSISQGLLWRACVSGNVSLLRRMLDLGADPADEGLVLRAMSVSMESLRIFLSAYSKRYSQGRPNFGWWALQRVIKDRDMAFLRLFISSKFDINAIPTSRYFTRDYQLYDDPNLQDLQQLSHWDATPLGSAVSTSHATSLEIAKVLLDSGADMSTVGNVEGFAITALCAAIRARNLEMVEFLIDRGADVNLLAILCRNRTPLQCAAEVGDFDIVQRLLDHKAYVNDIPAREGGGTPLQLAAMKGYLGIVLLLLENGANVNAQPALIHGRTALEAASEYGRIDTVQLLLNVGAEIEGPRGLRSGLAVELAEENGHFATVELLRSYLEPTPDVGFDDQFPMDWMEYEMYTQEFE